MDIALRFDYGEDKLADLPLEELIAFVLASRKLPQTTSVSVTFVSNERIHELNRDYRGIDKPTDVLSFECDNIPFEGEAIDQNEEYELGDVICIGDARTLYYCFPKTPDVVARTRLAAEELYKIVRKKEGAAR